MKKLIPLFFLILFACTKHAPVEVKKGRLYFVTVRSHSKNDTTYIDKPEHIASEEGFICRTSFCNIDPFCGQVTKYIKNPEAIDGTSVEYHTNDLGIIYSLTQHGNPTEDYIRQMTVSKVVSANTLTIFFPGAIW